MKHGLKVMFGLVHEFEVDPVEQYKFHLFFSWFWIGTMVLTPIIVPHVTSAEDVGLAILEVSLWANFVSHFTAVGAALSGIISSGRMNEISTTPVHHILRFFFWRKRRAPANFSNPNYRPEGWQHDPLGRDDLEDVSNEPYTERHS